MQVDTLCDTSCFTAYFQMNHMLIQCHPLNLTQLDFIVNFELVN